MRLGFCVFASLLGLLLPASLSVMNIPALATEVMHEEEKDELNRLDFNKLLDSGKNYNNRRKFSRALQTFEEALEVSLRIGDNYLQIEALQQIYLLKMRLSLSNSEINRFYLEILDKTSDIGTPNQKVTLFIEMGELHLHRGQTELAEDFYKKSLKTAQSIGDDISETSAYTAYGYFNLKLANYVQSLESYKKALELSKKIQLNNKTGDLLRTIGGIFSSLGDSETAIGYSLSALRAYEDAKMTEEIIASHWSISGTYEYDLKQPQKAIKFIQQELKKYSGKNLEVEADLLRNLGWRYNSLGLSTLEAMPYP